jgi:DNA polymerase-3 subunit alpha
MTEFIHLHNHSHYSILDGITKIDQLMKTVKAHGQKAVALTDHGNMFGAMEFEKEAKKAEIKPVFGFEAYVAPESRFAKNKEEKYYHLVLLAMDNTGYRNLLKLTSAGYLEGMYSKPRIDYDLLRAHNRGLIAMSACLSGEIPRMILDNNEARLWSALDFFTDVFGKERFFLELQDHGLPEEKIVCTRLIELSKKTGLSLVATNDCHYLSRSDAKVQEIMFCIRDKKVLSEKHFQYDTDRFHFASPDEMAQLFSGVPEAIANTVKIAEMCDVHIEYPAAPHLSPHLPLYPLPGGETADSWTEKQAFQGLATHFHGGEIPENYLERLKMELDLVKKMGFSNYFLIVSDFIKYAKKNGIFVGPGRGSAAGALLSYTLSITDVDPIKYNLLFERFLNPERVSMPDIDVDFQDDRRDEVKEYIRYTYGYTKTANIITFGYLLGRSALKDVARVLEIPLEKVNRLTKQIDNKMAAEGLPKILEQVPELKEVREKGLPVEKDWIEYSLQAEGSIRNIGTHASGVIISRTELTDVIPLFKEAGGSVIQTQYEGEYLEKNGLLKMDILGLSNLTMIQDCLSRIKRRFGLDLDIFNVPLDDQEVYQLFWRGETNGIFQFESDGMTAYLKQLKPNCIDDLIAMNALYRPGPMDNIPSYISRKLGREPVDCFHKNLEPILAPTYGVIVYQEQVMQMAQVLAGFSLGKADKVRRIMAKKKPEELEKIRPEWIDGAVKNGYTKELAEKLFEILVPFSNYAFNKSHSAAYAILAYQIAYLKAHYYPEFIASLLTLNMGSSDSVKLYCQDSNSSGVRILPPDINTGRWEFQVVQRDGKDCILFGLGAVKGLGEGFADSLFEERESGGDFTSMDDFIRRMYKNPEFKRNGIETLVKAGAFDSLIPADKYLQEKAVILSNLEAWIDQVQKQTKEKEGGQLALFGSDDAGGLDIHINRAVKPLTQKEDFENEVSVFGFYLSGRLFDAHADVIGLVSNCSTSLFEKVRIGTGVLLWGFVGEVAVKTAVNGKPYAVFTIDNGKDVFRFFLFSEKYDMYKAHLVANNFVMVKVLIKEGKKGRKADVTDVKPVGEVLKQRFGEIHVCVDKHAVGGDRVFVETLASVKREAELPENRGQMRFVFHVIDGADSSVIDAGDRFRVRYSAAMLQHIAKLPGMLGYWLY